MPEPERLDAVATIEEHRDAFCLEWRLGSLTRCDRVKGHLGPHSWEALYGEWPADVRRRIIELCETETSETGGRPLAVRILRLLNGEDKPDA